MNFPALARSGRRRGGRRGGRRGATALFGAIALGGLLAGQAAAAASPYPANAARAQAGRALPVPASGMRPACPAAPPGYQRCLVLYQSQAAVNLAIAEGITSRASRRGP